MAIRKWFPESYWQILYQIESLSPISKERGFFGEYINAYCRFWLLKLAVVDKFSNVIFIIWLHVKTFELLLNQ